MRQVFLSYCREDGDFAQILRDELRKAGVPTWQDVDVRGGEEWGDEIDRAIRDALTVVLVMSPESQASPYVNYEWAFALGAGVTVIPLLLRLDPAKLHPRLGLLQCLDFSVRAARPWDALIRTLREVADSRRPFSVRVPRDAPPVVQQAARALDGLDLVERRAAIDNLRQMNHPSAVEVLADAVQHPVQEVRILAAVGLSDFGDPRALPGLIEGIRAGAEDAKFWLLSRLGKGAVTGLIGALSDDDPDVRCAAAMALGKIRDAAAEPALQRTLQDADASVRAAAIKALACFPEAPVAEDISRALEDQESEVRLAAADAFSELGGETGNRGLAKALASPDRELRNKAAAALARIGTSAALPALLEALRDEYDQARANAARALGTIGDPDIVPALLQAWEDEAGIVRHAALESLQKIGGPAAVAGLLAILRDKLSDGRSDAARALGEIGDTTAVPDLIEALRDDNKWVREEAARSLGILGDKNCAAALIEALRDDDADVSQSAVFALNRLRTPEALAALRAWRREKR